MWDAYRRVPWVAKATQRVPYRFYISHWFPCNVSTLYCTGYLPAAVLTLGIYTTAVLLLSSLERLVLAGGLVSSHYCCGPSIDVPVRVVALGVPGLTALVARGGVFQISCEGDQLGPFGLLLCAGCGGGYVFTSLRTRWCVRVPCTSVQYALAAWA